MDEVSAKYLREINSKLIKNVAWNVSLHNLSWKLTVHEKVFQEN